MTHEVAKGRRRSRRATAVVAVVVGLGLTGVAAGCGGGSSDGAVEVGVRDDETPAAILARAADSATTVESGRMRGTVTYDLTMGDRTAQATMAMEGAFTDGGRRSEMTADMGAYMRSIAGQMGAGAGDLADVPTSMVMHIVQDGSTMYMKFDVDPPEPGTEYWYATDLAEMGLDTSALESPAGLGGGPTSYAETLRGAGADVVEAGTEQIDGVEVTRFEGTVDPTTAIDKADPDKRAELRRMLRESGMTEPMPFVAWVDGDGVLRRMQMTMTMGTGPMSVVSTTVVDYVDLGADVTVTVPPADLVRDASELTGQPA